MCMIWENEIHCEVILGFDFQVLYIYFFIVLRQC